MSQVVCTDWIQGKGALDGKHGHQHNEAGATAAQELWCHQMTCTVKPGNSVLQISQLAIVATASSRPAHGKLTAVSTRTEQTVTA